MSFVREKSTGARNIFKVYHIGVIERDKNRSFLVLRINPRFRKALKGLEKFKKLLMIYIDGGELDVHKAVLRNLEKDELYLDYSREIEGLEVIDIKPYFRELDE